jgi:phospholipase C
MQTSRTAAAAALAIAFALSGCASSRTTGAAGNALPAAPMNAAVSLPTGNYIKHIVVIVQENRSFVNLFAGWPGADAPTFGYYKDAKGKRNRIKLQPITFVKKDLTHNWTEAIAGWDNGKMDGFENNQINGREPAGTFPYSYLKHTVIEPYRTMASQYVLVDHMFPAMFGPSFTAHLDLVASTTNITNDLAIVDLPNASPWGCDAPAGTTTSLVNTKRVILHGKGPFPCFSRFRTMADSFDAAGVSWKYYAPNILKGPAWSAFDAIKNVRYGPDWAKVVSPQTQVLADAAGGNLPSFTWVTPDARDSDHPGQGSDTGPSWVASVVNAIGQGPDWNSTAIVLLWDDWGGWYDDAPPPQLDFKGLGIRVGCLIISPYTKAGTITHTQYEFGSILKFAEQTFNLPPLGSAAAGYTDGRAASLVDSFDFTQAPRPFVKIPAKYPASYFLTQPQSMKVPDTSD